MSDKSTNPKVQALVDAARTLGASQVIAARTNHVRNSLTAAKEAATVAVTEAELALAEVDVAYSTAKLRKLRCEAELQNSTQRGREICAPCENARRQLWSIASTADEASLVAAAEKLATAMEAFWAFRQETEAVRVELESASADLRRASEARKTAVKNRGRAQGDLESAVEALRQFCSRPSSGSCGYALEGALIDAACDLTGMRDKAFAYSYVDTSELPVWTELATAAAAHIASGGGIDDHPLAGKVASAIDEAEIAAIADGAVQPIV